MTKDTVLIGVDGGATKVSAWQIEYNGQKDIFSMGKLNAQKSYLDIPGHIADFKPIDVPTQIAERDQGIINSTDSELQQQAVYVEACAQVIEEIAKQSGKSKVLVGIGMPGLKTEDKRGIAVVANGPRMLEYSDLLEERLKFSPIPQ